MRSTTPSGYGSTKYRLRPRRCSRQSGEKKREKSEDSARMRSRRSPGLSRHRSPRRGKVAMERQSPGRRSPSSGRTDAATADVPLPPAAFTARSAGDESRCRTRWDVRGGRHRSLSKHEAATSGAARRDLLDGNRRIEKAGRVECLKVYHVERTFQPS